MYFIAVIFILIIAIILILVVLVQNSKGGGLSSSFGGGGGNQFGGVAQTNKFLEKATWGLAIALLFFSLVASISITSKQEAGEQSNIYEHIQNYDFDTKPTVPAEINIPE